LFVYIYCVHVCKDCKHSLGCVKVRIECRHIKYKLKTALNGCYVWNNEWTCVESGVMFGTRNVLSVMSGTRILLYDLVWVELYVDSKV